MRSTPTIYTRLMMSSKTKGGGAKGGVVGKSGARTREGVMLEFNSALKGAIRHATGSTGSVKAMFAVRRVNTLLNDAPTFAITEFGPYLLKHRERIEANDEKFFKDHNLLDEIDLGREEAKEDIIALAEAFKKVYTRGSAKEISTMNAMFNGLLKLAVEYAAMDTPAD